jgi:hypothetical protein
VAGALFGMPVAPSSISDAGTKVTQLCDQESAKLKARTRTLTTY